MRSADSFLAPAAVCLQQNLGNLPGMCIAVQFWITLDCCSTLVDPAAHGSRAVVGSQLLLAERS